MTRGVVLGCGLIGRAMTLDLARDGEYEVTVADANEASLEGLRHRPEFTVSMQTLAIRFG
jgi:saccharopine dehydrogenase-like NADP-dependent oxidoreductase